MGSIAILASGSGSNFEAICGELSRGRHEVRLLVCDRPGAFVLERAKRLGVPAFLASYKGRERPVVEREISQKLDEARVDLVVLAGYMRLLGPDFVGRYKGRLVNIHPSLLPAWPGTEAIARAWRAGDSTMGVTVHFVDEGMDTGPIIRQLAVQRRDSLADTETAIHQAEHLLYPLVILELLESTGEPERC